MNLPNNLKLVLLAGVAILILALAYYVNYEKKKQAYLDFDHSQATSPTPFISSSLATPSPTQTPSQITICPSTITDIDGNTYNTVQTGSQCWMKENLKVIRNPKGKPITRHCYNDDPKICNTDGGLYDWNTAMNNSIGCNGTGASQPQCTTPVQGICSSGWHIPSHYEWTLLEKNIGSNPNAFPYDETTYNWLGTDEGTNLKQGGSSGFEAIFAGDYDPTNDPTIKVNLRGAYAFFWSSTEKSRTEAWDRWLYSTFSNIQRFTDDKTIGFSVRCLKD